MVVLLKMLSTEDSLVYAETQVIMPKYRKCENQDLNEQKGDNKLLRNLELDHSCRVGRYF